MSGWLDNMIEMDPGLLDRIRENNREAVARQVEMLKNRPEIDENPDNEGFDLSPHDLFSE